MEDWKKIPGKTNYLISNYGRVLSLKRKDCFILKNIKHHKQYYYVNLEKKQFFIHRLVAQSFLGLDISDSNIYVMHQDDNGLNNHVSNLKLGTHHENMIDRNNKGRCAKIWDGKKGKEHNCYKEVLQYGIDGKFIKKYYGASEANRITGISRSGISKTCLGRQKLCGGFIWKFNY